MVDVRPCPSPHDALVSTHANSFLLQTPLPSIPAFSLAAGEAGDSGRGQTRRVGKLSLWEEPSTNTKEELEGCPVTGSVWCLGRYQLEASSLTHSFTSLLSAAASPINYFPPNPQLRVYFWGIPLRFHVSTLPRVLAVAQQ